MDLARAVAGADAKVYDCATCTARGHQALFGHDGPPLGLWRDNLVSGEPLQRCPMRDLLEWQDAGSPLLEELERHLRYRRHYQQGVLLEAGGLAAQPARYIAWLDAIDDAAITAERRRQEITKNAEDEP